MTLQLVSPRKDQLRADILDECWLEVIQFECAVGTVIDPECISRCQLHLLKLQADGLVDAFDELRDGGIDAVED